MATELGLRERKKLKTRQLLTDIARRRFQEKGVAATTVEEICDEAEVSVATFFRYFRSKEDAAFPEQATRVEIVRSVLSEPLKGEKPSATIRRAVQGLVSYDQEQKGELQAHIKMLAENPSLAAEALRIQSEANELFIGLVASLLDVDPAKDLRPALVVHSVQGAVNVAWSAWLAQDLRGDLAEIIDDAMDLLDKGFLKTLA